MPTSACATSHILGQVTNEELTALYDVADLFLCASEHEGFCVPLIEAFYKRVPVVALRGDGRAGARWTAAACCTSAPIRARGGRLCTRRACRSRRRGRRCSRARTPRSIALLAQDFAGLVVGFVDQVLAGAAAAPAAVAPDFWRQFKLADELEVIRADAASGLPRAAAAPPDEPVRSPTWGTDR